MNRKIFIKVFLRFCVSFFFVGLVFLISRGGFVFSDMPEFAEKFNNAEWEKFRENGESILRETLNAYNEGDYVGFNKAFSSRRRALTSRAFEAIWQGDYMVRYGKFISLEFFPEKSNPVNNYPLLTYKAVFENNSEVGIRCVFVKGDDGEYRIFYLRFDPYQDLFH